MVDTITILKGINTCCICVSSSAHYYYQLRDTKIKNIVSVKKISLLIIEIKVTLEFLGINLEILIQISFKQCSLP